MEILEDLEFWGSKNEQVVELERGLFMVIWEFNLKFSCSLLLFWNVFFYYH